jgi:DNA-binding GntR family transcriptional regulator
MVDPTPLRATSLHDSVATQLRNLVFDRELAPGEWIDEKALAGRWQISRTPLREALKVLAAEGLVELVPHRGCRVVEISEPDADALFPVMALLEGRCALEACQKADEADLRRLQQLHDELEHHAAAGDIDGYYRANHAFHSQVQALARNRWLDRVTADLRRFMRLMRGRQLMLPGRLAASLKEHRALISAFTARDAERAGSLMQQHLMSQLSALKKLRQHEAAAAADPSSPSPANHPARRTRRHA